jgi:hypothetical protein
MKFPVIYFNNILLLKKYNIYTKNRFIVSLIKSKSQEISLKNILRFYCIIYCTNVV